MILSGMPRHPPQGQRNDHPRNDVQEPVRRVRHAEPFDDGRQPIAQTVGRERESDIKQREQNDALVEQRPERIGVFGVDCAFALFR